MQKCEKCGKDFYSDMDFEQHQLIEEQRAYLNVTIPCRHGVSYNVVQ